MRSPYARGWGTPPLPAEWHSPKSYFHAVVLRKRLACFPAPPVVLRKLLPCFPAPPLPLFPRAGPTRPPRGLACFWVTKPPSSVADLLMLRQVQLGVAEKNTSRYDGLTHNPDDATQPALLPDKLPLGFCRLPYVDPQFVLPAALMHPAFGQFADEVAALRVEKEDCDLVAALIQNGDEGMAHLHVSEAGYQEVFYKHYRPFLQPVGLELSVLKAITASRDQAGKAVSGSSLRIPRSFKIDASVWDKSGTTPLCILVRPPSALPSSPMSEGRGGRGGQGCIRFAADIANHAITFLHVRRRTSFSTFSCPFSKSSRTTTRTSRTTATCARRCVSGTCARCSAWSWCVDPLYSG